MGLRLIEKRFIRGKLEVVTGLHIGGAKSSLDIGAIDLSVVKTAAGVPFIPGSSLKGKLRSLLAREHGSDSVATDPEPIPTLFGSPNAKRREGEGDGAAPAGRDRGGADDRVQGTPARLIVRDAFLDLDDFEKRADVFAELEMDYTESKWENTINRLTGTAEHPRQLERVPAGVLFDFELVLNVMDDGQEEEHLTALRKAMRLLEDDYLGGQGSRGYGRVRFVDVVMLRRTLAQYQDGEPASEMEADFLAAAAVPA